jgi:hypothetical protein
MAEMHEIDLQDPPVSDRASAPKLGERLQRAGEGTVVWLHKQADRMDLLPPEFGDEAEVDASDAKSLVREWLRQVKLWAAYSPEQVLAIKVGAVVLAGALLALIVLVGAIR